MAVKTSVLPFFCALSALLGEFTDSTISGSASRASGRGGVLAAIANSSKVVLLLNRLVEVEGCCSWVTSTLPLSAWEDMANCTLRALAPDALALDCFPRANHPWMVLGLRHSIFKTVPLDDDAFAGFVGCCADAFCRDRLTGAPFGGEMLSMRLKGFFDFVGGNGAELLRVMAFFGCCSGGAAASSAAGAFLRPFLLAGGAASSTSSTSATDSSLSRLRLFLLRFVSEGSETGPPWRPLATTRLAMVSLLAALLRAFSGTFHPCLDELG
mmetsp:Transcript_36173/g.84797  ORF Transcript_36173/g.84797 Transcript_36173/m.84797 type:complete len:269 (-) Transcript_36173:149-955(-)